MDARTTAALALTVTAGFAWAALAHVDEVTRGEGRVIPASRIQLVQNLEGGIVRRIATREGARVAEGDLLVQIDATGFGSSLEERREKLTGLRAVLARLEAMAEGRALEMPDDIAASRPDLAREQAELHAARRSETQAALASLDLLIGQRRQEIEELGARTANLRRAVEITNEEIALTRPLVDAGSGGAGRADPAGGAAQRAAGRAGRRTPRAAPHREGAGRGAEPAARSARWRSCPRRARS